MTIHKLINNGSLKIFDEDFNIFSDNGLVIQHKKWLSVVGRGNTLDSAISDMVKTIKQVKPTYCGLDDSLLTYDGIEMRNWLSTIVIDDFD